MNYGELKHPISLMKKTTTSTDTRFTTTDWTEWKKVFAKIEKEKRSTIIVNDKVSENRTILFTIRYQKVIEEMELKDIRIHYKEKEYEITNMEDKDFEQKYLVLSASEVI
ncbi:phage head closure protein [Cytobacillus firmus]|uniref:phage head closure protein n=1 Tax=Cytobacillus firmus TaxID=1399 RepID=UPI0018CCB826|nr:phage head closure protein [Cytobacillus firmus]MBG9657092.1 hypothetical protein [Cytobacillus firmus]MED1906765.1 phage head closure protein [Cytobacillus firmus]